jgi:putative MATE family efflux protein
MAITKKAGCDLTTGVVLQALIIFAIPIILSNLIQQLYSLVDLIVIGQYVGNEGTVGVSTGGEISDMLMTIATTFATAGQIYIAQLAGAKREDDIKRGSGTLLTMMLLLSTILMAAVILFRKEILELLNCPALAFYEAERYMVITAFGLPFVFGYNAVCGVLRGMGESRKPMLFIIVAAIVNVILDLILVVFFRLDVTGTAIATAFSQIASCVAAFVYLYLHHEQFDFELSLSYFTMNKESAYIILSLGIPQMIRSILVRCSMLWVNAGINEYGLVLSAMNSIGNKLQKFLEVYILGFSQASAAMVGQNIGARKLERAKNVVLSALLYSLVSATVISLIAVSFSNELFGVFTKDVDVQAMGDKFLKIMILHFFMSAITGSFQAMVTGTGFVLLDFIIGILDGVVCKIGLSLLFVSMFHMGAFGYIWGTALSRVLPGLICIIYFFSGVWKKHSLLTE